MTAMTDLATLALTAGEQTAVAAVGMTGQDAIGTIDSCVKELYLVRTKLGRVSANMGAGANKTKVDALITAIT